MNAASAPDITAAMELQRCSKCMRVSNNAVARLIDIPKRESELICAALRERFGACQCSEGDRDGAPIRVGKTTGV